MSRTPWSISFILRLVRPSTTISIFVFGTPASRIFNDNKYHNFIPVSKEACDVRRYGEIMQDRNNDRTQVRVMFCTRTRSTQWHKSLIGLEKVDIWGLRHARLIMSLGGWSSLIFFELTDLVTSRSHLGTISCNFPTSVA